MKEEILQNLCYTELVYSRINKKLKINFSRQVIENLIRKTIEETDENSFQKIGKNFYMTNFKNKIKVTVNSFSFRVITVDKI